MNLPQNIVLFIQCGCDKQKKTEAAVENIVEL